MAISKKVAGFLGRASFIRKMFEEASRMRADGKGPVYDFSLGNPDLEPPAEFRKRLFSVIGDETPGAHKYMANVGYESTRQAVAASLAREHGLPFTAESVIMTVGAGGALNTVLKAILDDGDEVITPLPFFVEYTFYADNHGGTLVKVPSQPDFQPDVAAIEAAITPRTKVLLTNSPHNPTGAVYRAEVLAAIGDLLRRKSEELGHTIYWISDEPYRRLIYDLDCCPSLFAAYGSSIMVTSHSKDLGLPGERIGYLAISPRADEPAALFGAMAFTNRTLGFVNAPALMQRVIETLQDVTVDLEWYRRKRDLLFESLTRFGYEVTRPEGAFYIFPKAPGGDDISFVAKMQEKRVLVVPGTGFGAPGYFRIAYCVDDAVIEGALPLFEEAIQSG